MNTVSANTSTTAVAASGPADGPRAPEVPAGRSLFRKYATYFVSLVSAALIASGLVGLYFTYQESKTARLNLQYEKAKAAAAHIERFIEGVVQQLSWVQFPRLDSLSMDDRQREYERLLAKEAAITAVRLLDESGHEHLFVSRLGRDRRGAGTDLSADPGFVQASAGRMYFSPVDFNKATEAHMKIAVPGKIRASGVVIADVNLQFIWDVITRMKVDEKALSAKPSFLEGLLGRAEPADNESRGVAYVVDANGRLIAHSDISVGLQNADLSGLAQVEAARASREAERRNRAASPPIQRDDAPEPVMIANDFRKPEVRVLSAYAPVEPVGWHVFVEQPRDDAFAPLYASLLRTALLLLAGLVFAVTIGLFLARHMVRPIRAIGAAAARIAAGKLDQRIDVRTGDELQVLAAEFNNMAEQLRESYSGLERKVEERTRDLSESLEQQTATSEVLKTISRSSFDLTRVLEEMIKCVVKLGRADAGGLYLRRADGIYELRTSYADDARLHEPIAAKGRHIDPRKHSASGRAIATKQPAQIPDVRHEADYAWPEAPFRTALAVPILREGQPIGVIVVLKVVVQPFTEKQIALIGTFADQAGIAIENARLFQETQNKSRELELANRHKSEFLANVSHELRTPLNAIIGFSEVLRERMFGELNEKQAEYLDDIHGSGKHLLALINDILNLSKIEAGRMDLDLARFSVHEALHAALNLVRERASRQRIALGLEVDADVGVWVADERKFKQIMLNLLSNAVKFTPEGGSVTVRCTRHAGALRVAVTDTGIGIAPDHLEIIFDEFRQVGRDYLRRSEGTGLGLALTKRYVELHGGRIEVESTPGVGSAFTFTLPELTLDAHEPDTDR